MHDASLLLVDPHLNKKLRNSVRFLLYNAFHLCNIHCYFFTRSFSSTQCNNADILMVHRLRGNFSTVYFVSIHPVKCVRNHIVAAASQVPSQHTVFCGSKIPCM
jgi:hypothetical protein